MTTEQKETAKALIIQKMGKENISLCQGIINERVEKLNRTIQTKNPLFRICFIRIERL